MPGSVTVTSGAICAVVPPPSDPILKLQACYKQASSAADRMERIKVCNKLYLTKNRAGDIILVNTLGVGGTSANHTAYIKLVDTACGPGCYPN